MAYTLLNNENIEYFCRAKQKEKIKMKKTRLMLMAMLACFCCMGTQAQGLKDLLNGISNVAEQITGKSTTVESIAGTWTYDSPQMKLESDNVLAKLGSAAANAKVSGKLGSVYKKVGLDKISITFNADSTYTSTINGRETAGTYSLDTKNKTLTMKTRLGLSLKTHVNVSGDHMTLLFESEKLMDGLKTVTNMAAQVNSTASTINSLIKSYDGISLGFKLKKTK